MKRSGQVGVEYMIIIGFVTIAIMSILVLAYFYSNEIKDRIRLNQVENFAAQLVSSAESDFFQGEPSKTTVRLYLPEGIEAVTLDQYNLIITTRTSSGQNIRAFSSDVILNGTISSGEGIKKLALEAKPTYVQISQVS